MSCDHCDACRAAGQAPVLLLNQGIWRLSRHPNYFGEVLFHTGMALFAVNLVS